MNNQKNVSGKQRSALITFIMAIVLIISGYFGYPLVGENEQQSQNQQVEQVQNEEEEPQQDAASDEQASNEDISGQQKEDTSSAETGQEASGTQTVPEEEISYEFRSEKLWDQHYEKHGIEMGFESREAYLSAANKVIANENALHKLEAEDGDDVYYLEKTNEFVVVSSDGYLRTYFNPGAGIDYFNRQ